MRIPCTAREIAAAVGGKLLQDGDTARRVSTDSRDILTGDLFNPWWASGSTATPT